MSMTSDVVAGVVCMLFYGVLMVVSFKVWDFAKNWWLARKWAGYRRSAHSFYGDEE